MTDETPDRTGDRLRAALADRATAIRPSSDGLDRIEEAVMSGSRSRNARRWVVGGLSAAAAIVLVVVALAVTREDDAAVVAETTTTGSGPTTTEPTSTTFTRDVDAFAVAYPSPGASQRFESPVAAARSYATGVLGFTELSLGEFQQGDDRSGEVPVTDRPGNQETTILLRQMEDDTWYVLGSQFPDITVDTPTAGDEISSPFATSGQALAFEGTVDVVVRAQDDPAPLAEDFVTGSGTPPPGPFEKEIPFEAPDTETPGILVYRIASAEDGHITAATSLPVHLLAG